MGNEKVILGYDINSNLDWMRDNLPKFISAYEKMKESGADVRSWVISSGEFECVHYQVEGDKNSLEEALERLFTSECGLPSEVTKPSLLGGTNRKGFNTTERLINKYGKKLKTPFKGGLVRKVVV